MTQDAEVKVQAPSEIEILTECPDGEHTYYRTERGEYCDSCGLDWDRVRYCRQPVQGYGELCGLDKNHRGHHSCVARHCDGCGRMRRASQIVAWHDVEGQFCWWCVNRPRPWN